MDTRKYSVLKENETLYIKVYGMQLKTIFAGKLIT